MTLSRSERDEMRVTMSSELFLVKILGNSPSGFSLREVIGRDSFRKGSNKQMEIGPEL